MTKNKAKKTEDLEQQLGELTLDLQRTRADSRIIASVSRQRNNRRTKWVRPSQ